MEQEAVQSTLFQIEPQQKDESKSSNHQAVFARIRNFLAGRFIGATRDETLLREVLKCLHTKTFIEQNPKVLPDGFDPVGQEESFLARVYRKVFANVRDAFPSVFAKDEEFLLDPSGLALVMRELFQIPLVDAKRDAVGDAFEVFIGSHIRGQAGQFFTPRNAVSLLVRAITPSAKETIIDPACGAGGFLSATLQYLIGRGTSGSKLRDFVSSRLFGVDKDSYLTELARAHLTLLAGAPARIACADSIAWQGAEGQTLTEVPSEGEYDKLLTNPPFGSRIVAATESVLSRYELARKWKPDSGGPLRPTTEYQRNVPPQVLFVERCIKLVKPGGTIGMVVPESLISSSIHRYVVEFIQRHCKIELVAGMPENLFKTSGKGGTHTKTCLVVLERKKAKANGPTNGAKIFMAEARWCGHDSRGKEIPYDDLATIADNFEANKQGKLAEQSPLGFLISEKDLRDQVLAPRQYDPSVREELIQLGKTHRLLRFGDLVDKGVLSLSTGDEVGKLAYGTGSYPFIRTSDISNWEIKADPKHGLSESTFEKLRVKQDVQEGDILLVRDGTYLIGTCAMVSRLDTKIVFQSHIYKIRVHENDQDLSPYLLLAALSSDSVQHQIKAKRVTQDIIDSLGNRILDLVLPIPEDKKLRQEISDLVKSAVENRVKARQLSLRAKRLVGGQLDLGS